MIENVTRSLVAALPGCTAEEIADVLWLVTARDTRREAAPVMPDGSERPDLPPVSAAEATPDEAGGTEAMPEATQSELTLAQSGDSAPGGRMVPAIEVGLGSPEPTTRRLSTARALAQFKRIHGPGPPTVDVEASVEATADARRLVVVTSPGRERGLDVALVVDSSPVMSVCHGELAEFEALLRRAGAFRSVTRWTLVPDPPPHQARGSRVAGPGPDVMIRDSAGVEHHTDRLLDPSGRRLVLLATDAVADHWYRAGVWQAIRRWAQMMPTAVIDVLPEQYRTRTALGMSVAVMRSRRPAGPNTAADVQVAWWEADLLPEGELLAAVPLPVVALQPQALEVWAEAVTAAGTAWVDAVWAQRPPGLSPGEANANLTAEDRVHAFLGRASRDAQALARILAMAPILTLPLIRVLQAGLLPGTGSSELAEVLIGGLLERVPGQADRTGPGRFRFRPAIRELLLRGMTATQEWDTHKVITEYLKKDARTGGDIHALIADPQGSTEVDVGLEPFAALGYEVASRLGLRLGNDDEASGQHTEEPATVPDEREHTPEAEYDRDVDEQFSQRSDEAVGSVAELGDHGGGVSALAVLADGRLASGGDDGQLRIWDPATASLLAELGGQRGGVSALAVLADGRLASGGDDGQLRIWDPATPASPAELGGPGGAISALAVFPDGRLASGGDDGQLQIWDPATPASPALQPDTADGQTSDDAKVPGRAAKRKNTRKPQLPYSGPPGITLDETTGPAAIQAGVSPDAGWPMLKNFLEGVKESLTIGLYDFTSAHILSCINLYLPGKTVRLVLDHPGLNPTADQTNEQTVASLQSALGPGLRHAWALTTPNPLADAWIFPTAYMPKIAVRDHSSIWVSSASWNNSSLPDIDPVGLRHDAAQARARNRDWHVIIDQPQLAATFEAILTNDFDIAAAHNRSGSGTSAPEITPKSGRASGPPFDQFYAPRSVTGNIRITPLLSPDNNNYTDRIKALILGATTSLCIQLQYIQPPRTTSAASAGITELISAVINRQDAGVDVKIILSEFETTGHLEQLQAAGLNTKKNVRIQRNMHNMGMVVDGSSVVISSAPWSTNTQHNRNAGVIIHHSELAGYFRSIFLHDWTKLARRRVTSG